MDLNYYLISKIPIFVVILFVIASFYLFNLVYKTTENIIDELFHIPQGLAYCHGNFSRWDPKITTLPGLYIISTIFLYPLRLCSGYNLRLINLAGSFVNLFLLSQIRTISARAGKYGQIISAVTEQYKEKTFYYNLCKGPQTAFWSAFNIALLPALYFFSFVYYTDVLSLTSVLCMLLAYGQRKHVLASIFGGVSILMRQTNVLWVGMCAGNFLIDTLVLKYGKRVKIKSRLKQTDQAPIDYTFEDVHRTFSALAERKVSINDLTIQEYLNIFAYAIVGGAFVTFVYINGSIVIGDKSAHEASLHIPQIFYFSLFYLIFSLITAITKLKPFLLYILRNKILSLIIISIFILIVHFNTIVHPYLLADNRHYTFYVWNRFYGRYPLFKYAATFIYYFGLFTIFEDLKDKTTGFILMFSLATASPLILQKMLEVRYFLLPFVIIKLNVKNVSKKELFLTSCWYLLLNVLSFYVFFTKEIMWSNFDDVQRLIW